MNDSLEQPHSYHIVPTTTSNAGGASSTPQSPAKTQEAFEQEWSDIGEKWLALFVPKDRLGAFKEAIKRRFWDAGRQDLLTELRALPREYGYIQELASQLTALEECGQLKIGKQAAADLTTLLDKNAVLRQENTELQDIIAGLKDVIEGKTKPIEQIRDELEAGGKR